MNDILNNYNFNYNIEMYSLPHGTPVSMEELQAISLECALKALVGSPGDLREDLMELAIELRKQGQRSVDELSTKDSDQLEKCTILSETPGELNG